MNTANQDDFWRLRRFGCHLTQKECADLCGVGLRQVQRWERGQARVPTSAVRLLKMISGEDLDLVDPIWSGWRIGKGGINPPGARMWIMPGEIAAIPYQYALVAELRRQLRRPQQYELGFDYSDVSPINGDGV